MEHGQGRAWVTAACTASPALPPLTGSQAPASLELSPGSSLDEGSEATIWNWQRRLMPPPGRLREPSSRSEGSSSMAAAQLPSQGQSQPLNSAVSQAQGRLSRVICCVTAKPETWLHCA